LVEVRVHPCCDDEAGVDLVDLTGLERDRLTRRREAEIVADVTAAQSPAGTDEAFIAEQELLVEVEVCERAGKGMRSAPRASSCLSSSSSP
jgi:hypothetical protein